ncbi:MAG: cation:proton antiporter [Candidatus Cloacimonetes bacterium]|nr:cation:proton antiporter [Candidatus Cloacimonadota bacterium]
MYHLLEMMKENFSHHIFFSAGLLLIGGYFLGKLAQKLKFPSITGYIVSGIIVGTSGLKLITHENMEMLLIISEITLSFIALIIGGEFSFSKLKIYGKKILILTLSQLFLTFALVSFGLSLLGISGSIALLLGSIAAATAPEVTFVIVQKLKVKGKFVDYLHGIIALNDVGTIILFSVVFTLFTTSISEHKVNIGISVLHGFLEIAYSLIAGVISGLLIHFSNKKKRNLKEIKIITLGILFLTTGICLSLHLSPLIANMTIGMMLINLSKRNLRILFALQPLMAPLYAVFFAIAGSELSFSIFQNRSVLFAGLLFIILRTIGKYCGIYFSAKVMKVDANVTKYLGLGLLPQAGVAIGLVLFVQASPLIENTSMEVQAQIVQMVNIILMSVFVNELLGPPIAKYAITKSSIVKK